MVRKSEPKLAVRWSYTVDGAPADFSGNIERFSGFAAVYDSYRPSPPLALAPILTRYAGAPRPELVVDLGSGTGLSTRYWAERAERVIGIEPSADMRRQAAERTEAANVSYREGLSHETGLPDDCAQIVTCNQALHWMAPQPTFEEAARILQPGGVFAATDYFWPPVTGHWQVDAAFAQCMARLSELAEAHGIEEKLQRWPKSGHLGRMQASGCFRFTKEIGVHHVDQGDADRLAGLCLSLGGVASLLKAGVSEAEMGLDELRALADEFIGAAGPSGAGAEPWYWSALIRLGIVT